MRDLTFDDGPWPENTPAVLKALADMMRCEETGEDTVRRDVLREVVDPLSFAHSAIADSSSSLARRWFLRSTQPVLGLRRRPGRQRNFMTIEAARALAQYQYGRRRP
jgi:hypothetical protein